MRDVFNEFLSHVAPQWDVPPALYARVNQHGWQLIAEYMDPYEAVLPFACLSTREAMVVMYGTMTNTEDESDTTHVQVLMYAKDGGPAEIATNTLTGFGESKLQESNNMGGLMDGALSQAKFLLATFPTLARDGLLLRQDNTNPDDAFIVKREDKQ